MVRTVCTLLLGLAVSGALAASGLWLQAQPGQTPPTTPPPPETPKAEPAPPEPPAPPLPPEEREQIARVARLLQATKFGLMDAIRQAEREAQGHGLSARALLVTKDEFEQIRMQFPAPKRNGNGAEPGPDGTPAPTGEPEKPPTRPPAEPPIPAGTTQPAQIAGDDADYRLVYEVLLVTEARNVVVAMVDGRAGQVMGTRRIASGDQPAPLPGQPLTPEQENEGRSGERRP